MLDALIRSSLRYRSLVLFLALALVVGGAYTAVNMPLDVLPDLTAPMAKQFGLTVTPWGAIAGGALTGKYLKGETGRLPEHSIRRGDRANSLAEKVVEIAAELGVPPVQVAFNWTRQRDPHLSVVPLIGASKATQIESSLGCCDWTIPQEHLDALDAASVIEMGFPHDFLATDNVKELIYGGKYGQIKR